MYVCFVHTYIYIYICRIIYIYIYICYTYIYACEWSLPPSLLSHRCFEASDVVQYPRCSLIHIWLLPMFSSFVVKSTRQPRAPVTRQRRRGIQKMSNNLHPQNIKPRQPTKIVNHCNPHVVKELEFTEHHNAGFEYKTI